jgi:hypothetical protein
MVSPKPLSDFVPDVTLIAFPILRRVCAAAAVHSPRANRFSFRVKESGLDTDIASLFRRKPELALFCINRARFRRLFAAAQSMTASKLANPLGDQEFLVLRRPMAAPSSRLKVCRQEPPKL